MEPVRLSPVAPYSLERTVGSFARFPEELVDVAQDGTYRRVLSAGGTPVLLEASQASGSGLDHPVKVRLLNPDSIDDPGKCWLAIVTIERMLSVLEPIDPVYQVMMGDPRLEFLASNLTGLRRTLDASPFEGLVSSILAQLISIRGAAVIRGRIVQRFGESLDFEGNQYWSFPDPPAVRESSVDELCGIGMTRVKAKAILAVAELSESGELDPLQLNQQSDADIIRHLVALPGIGPWTADWFLVNVMGRMSTVPSGDLGIRRATGKWLLDGEMPSPADVRRVYEPFGEVRAYVAYYVLSAERYRLEPR